jgi:putative endonuclease
MKRNITGARGEQLAGELLKKRGDSIIETNYRCRAGEIDIVAFKDECLVFVEVRTKTSDFGTPGESVTELKKQHLRAAAEDYLQNHENLPTCWRIDFVGVELDCTGKVTRIEVIENAVGEE